MLHQRLVNLCDRELFSVTRFVSVHNEVIVSFLR
jgi:hypothetical protein